MHFFVNVFFEYLFPKGTVHTNLVLINPHLGYFLWAEIPLLFNADETMYSISDYIFYKKNHEMKGSCANLMSLCAAQ